SYKTSRDKNLKYNIQGENYMRKNLIPAMTSTNQPSGETFGSSKWATTSEYFYAFNNNTTQNFTSNSPLPQYIGYRSIRACKVVSYSVTSRNLNNDDLPVAPTEWELQGSDDNSIWGTIDKRIGVLWTAKLEEKNFEIKNPQSFTYYRLYVTKNNGFATSIFGVNQMKLFYEGERLIINNPINMKYYSLLDNTLIHLPNNSPKNMILHGIEQGKEIQLDAPFSKLNYVNELPFDNVNSKVFTQEIEKINTLNIREIKEDNFEHIYTWYYTNMTSNTTPPPLIASSSSSQSANYAPFKAFNGTSINKDDCFMTSTNNVSEYIQIHYGTKKLINCVAITSRNSDEPTSAIKDVNILGSTDGINFTNIGEIRNQTDWTQNSKRIFNLIEGHYMTIKLEILSNNEEIRTTIGNILYGYKREVN
ncbi:discoidin domain-containing protein, partial [Metasolibacillus meyeri]|uniref:discoidin domain-containing protein n=1 Tax=Metasolibacillus meyeri TaxID=1071052 RepID=UPI001EE6B81A